LGTRLLAPHFGTTHFVWMAEITVTMLSLAAGYYLGGFVIDRKPHLNITYGAIAAAGLWVSTCGLWITKLVPICADLDPAEGSLLISFVAFFVPLLLLATVTPTLLRLLASEVKTLGRTAGRISAVSTLGSLLGTVAIGYLIIPLIPNSLTLYLTSATLLLLSVIHFLTVVRGVKGVTSTVALFLLAGGLGWQIRSEVRPPDHLQRLHTQNSFYGTQEVYDVAGTTTRVFMHETYPQNTIDTQTKRGADFYPYALRELTVGYLGRTPKNLLMIGLGAGVGIKPFEEIGTEVEGVEVSPETVEIARQYFDLKLPPERVFIEDGRIFVERHRHSGKRYDVIILDTFSGGGNIASHLITRESFLGLRDLLNDDGVLLMNSNFSTGMSDFMTGSAYRTMKSVFAEVAVHSSLGFNTFFVAANRPLALKLRPNLVWSLAADIEEELKQILRHRMRRIDDFEGIVLTDDFNPAEFRDARTRAHMFRVVKTYWYETLAKKRG
jgi:spermidine synthase